jgi:hypothetical protein
MISLVVGCIADSTSERYFHNSSFDLEERPFLNRFNSSLACRIVLSEEMRALGSTIFKKYENLPEKELRSNLLPVKVKLGPLEEADEADGVDGEAEAEESMFCCDATSRNSTRSFV